MYIHMCIYIYIYILKSIYANNNIICNYISLYISTHIYMESNALCGSWHKDGGSVCYPLFLSLEALLHLCVSV